MRAGSASRRHWRNGAVAGLCTLRAVCPAPSAGAEDEGVRTLLFGSMEAGPSVFAGSGFKAAPERVDREGFAMLAVVGAGVRLERGAASADGRRPRLVRATGLAALGGGYQFFFDWGVIGLFAGPEGSVETLIGGAASGGSVGRFGARLQGELWARPSETTLVTVTLVTGSARWDAYGRVSAGIAALGGYLGPEVSGYADRTGYDRWSLGLHATDFGFDAVRFRLSAGCSFEGETRRLGPYLSLAGWVPL